jgi:hypothetical protein
MFSNELTRFSSLYLPSDYVDHEGSQVSTALLVDLYDRLGQTLVAPDTSTAVGIQYQLQGCMVLSSGLHNDRSTMELCHEPFWFLSNVKTGRPSLSLSGVT